MLFISRALTDPYLILESRDVISGSSLRELKGENSYLKEQLHASVLRFSWISCESHDFIWFTLFRVKQLEALLLERNTHVKNLVSENLQLSIKCRKLMNALGEEETREALWVLQFFRYSYIYSSSDFHHRIVQYYVTLYYVLVILVDVQL